MSQHGNGQPSDDRDDKTPNFVKVSKYLAIGLEFPSTIFGGLILGYLLDQYFDSSPWLTLSATLLALVGGFVRLIYMLRRFSG